MKNTVKEYLLTIKKNKQLHLRLIAVILVLSMVTALGVTWSLKLDGIAKTDAASCGKEEHVHTEACYTKKLVCTEQSHTHSEEAGCYEERKNLTCSEAEHSHSESCYDEDGNLICDIPEHTHTDACYTTEKVLVCQQEESTHEHTDACYETVLTCDKQEHTHTSMCYADPEADLESAEDWEQTVPMRSELSGDWGKDVLKVAESQLGYHESTRNYTLGDDGTTLKGYTRYGQWYGVPYGDWCAMYASFCLHYAGIPEKAMPRSAGVFAWMTQLEEIGAFMPMEEMTEETFNPQPGDILFLDLTEDNGSNDPNHVGIVKSYDKEHRIIYVYEGNSDDQVREMAYLMPDYIEPEIEDVDSATGVPFHTPIVNMSLSEDSIIGYASLQMARDLFVERYLDGDESKLNAAEDDGFEKISAGTVEIAPFKPTEPEDELREQEPTETMPEDMESVSSDLRGYKKTSNSNRKIHVMVSVNDEWIEAGTISAANIYQLTRKSANEGKTRWAVTANDLETILSKYGFRATTYHGEGWMFPQSWGQTDTLYAFTADGAQKVGSTWLIPGGYDTIANSNGYLWYMPKNSKLSGFEDVGTESKFQYNGDWSLTKARVLTQNNTHYTISIADPIGVLSADKLTQVFYALNTSNTVLTLPKLSGGYVWKLYDLDGYEFSGSTTADSSGSDYRLTIRYIDQSLTVRVVEDGLQDITKSKTVTYKVLLDNEWVTVGEQDHYYFDPAKNRAFVMSYEAASFYAPYGYGNAKQDPGASFGYAVNGRAAYEILPSSNHNYAADLDGGKSDPGTNIHLWTRNYTENQMFRFIPVTNEYMMIVNVKTGKAWNVNGGGASDGKDIKQWNDDKTDTSNLWRMERHSDGTVSFLSRNNDHFAVDLAGNKTADGTNIQLYTYNDSAAQKWYLQQVNLIWNDWNAVKSGSSYRLYLSAYDDSYTVYYLPQWSGSVGKVKGVNELNSVFRENGFYTVRFIDKDGNETVQYARSGSKLTANLTTPGGYAWKAFNTEDMTDSSSGVSTSGSSVTVSNVTAPLTVRMLAQSELNTEKRTDVTVHFLADLAGGVGRSDWQEVGTETTTYHLSDDERIYVSATQLAKYYGKYGFDASKYNGEHSFFHNTQYSNVQFWNDAPIHRLADGAWMVGLNYNREKNVYCWYVPNITTKRSDKLSCNSSAVEPGAYLWKISVYDPNHLAYSNAQLNKMEQWCANGTSKTITLNNVANYMWFAIGDDGTLYDTTVGSTTTTISLTNVKGNVRIGLTTVNPSFTVLYRGNVQVLDKDTKTGVERKIIDTTGKNLPGFNATNPNNFSIYMDGNGNIRWKTKEVQLYTNRTFTVNESPALSYIDIASTYGNYKLKELRVQALGQTKTYAINGNVSGFTFTGIPSKASSTCIFLPDDSVLTVVYDSTTGESVQNANFYDYDITEGSNGWVHLYANGQYYNKGINFEGLYEQNGARQAYYIFGNKNTCLRHSTEKYNGAYINRSNMEDNGTVHAFSLCSFKMVQDSLSGDYKLKFQPGIWAPQNLFDTVPRLGKTVFENFKMKYSRNGDGYTFTAVGDQKSNYYLTNLEQFKKDCLAYGSDTNWIWSNRFWPMDAQQGHGQSDPMTGASGNPGTFHYHIAGNGANRYDGTYPGSDDGKAHDNMFGMTSVIDFYVPAEYTGPMDYLFYGDDDLWVYLQYPDGSTKLVCDIGGVHSSVGEYVDLRDYIPVGSSGDYKLRIFYTERGLSGSSCYIHYTLPNLSVNPIQNQTTSAILEKAVDGDAYPNQKYEFTFDVWNVTGGRFTRVPGMYSYTISRTDGTGNPKSGILNYKDESFTFTLRANERIEISGLPVGSQYRAEFVEAAYSICAPSFNESNVKNPYKSGGAEDRGRSFELTADPTQNRLLLTNVIVQPKLPATGGSGTTWYLVFGAGLMGTAVLLAAANGSAKRRRHRRNP